MMRTFPRQRGVALLTALLIAAILTSLTVYLAWDISLGIRRTQNMIDQDQAYELCLGAEAWAALKLQQNAVKHHNLVDLKQAWAKPLPLTHIGSGTFSASIADLQGRINLNNLRYVWPGNLETMRRFRHLLKTDGIPPDQSEAVIDWVDPVHPPSGYSGAESNYYMRLKPPYRDANRPFAVPSSLMLVRGFDTKLTQSLLPKLATLPAGAKININTAPLAILESLGMDSFEAKHVIRHRKQTPFTGIMQFIAFVNKSGEMINTIGLGDSSHYFLVNARADWGSSRSALYAVLNVNRHGEVKIELNSFDTSP